MNFDTLSSSRGNFNLPGRDNGVSPPIDIVKGAAGNTCGPAVVKAANSDIITGSSYIFCLKYTVIDDQVSFVPNRCTSICIAGNDLAALNNHRSATKILHTTGNDRPGADRIHQCKHPIIIDSIIVPAAVIWLYSSGQCKAVKIEYDSLADINRNISCYLHIAEQLDCNRLSFCCLQRKKECLLVIILNCGAVNSHLRKGNALPRQCGSGQHCQHHSKCQQYTPDTSSRFSHASPS